jgi:phosphatidylinositol 4-kinase A
MVFRPPSVRPNSLTVSTINFLTARRWSRGSNRLQMDTDSKLLTEFLSFLQADTARLALEVSSLGQAQATSMNSGKRTCPFSQVRSMNKCFLTSAYVSRLKSHSVPLKLLVENELYRLSVWANPANDSKRVGDYATNQERFMTDVSHSQLFFSTEC